MKRIMRTCHPFKNEVFSLWLFQTFATLGSILDSQLSWESGKFQLARWSHRVVLFSSLDHPQLSFFWQCCTVSPLQQSMCGVPTLQVYDFPRTQLLPPKKSMCGVPPPIGTLFRKYVRCPPLPVYTFSVRCPPPNLVLCLEHFGSVLDSEQNWESG